MDKDPGLPHIRQQLAFKLLEAEGDPVKLARVYEEFNVPLEDRATPAVEAVVQENILVAKIPAPSVEPTAAPPEPQKDFSLNLREDRRNDGILSQLERLLTSEPEGQFTLRNDNLGVDMDYLRCMESDSQSGIKVIRFLLPKYSSIRIRPTDDLILTRDGKDTRVTYIGDLHDFEGLIPAKMITFFSRDEEVASS